MSRSKVSILSKYVMAIAILALLFSVSLTTARYALNQSATVGVDIDSFDVDVNLYHDLGNGNREQVTGDINLDTNVESLSDYNEVYYLDITNGDNEILYYKIEEQSGNFCFKVGEESTRYTTYGDSVDKNTSIELTLTMSIRPEVLENLETGENRSLSIKLYAEYQHTEVYESAIVEEPEPEPEPEDENHISSEWNYLSNSNVSGATLDSSGNYCLIEDVELTSSMTISADITLCLNGHTLTASSGYTLSQLINITSGSVTIEDCQGTGSINGDSLTQAISLSGSSTNLTLTTASISGGDYNVAISNGATLNLNGATLTSGNTGSVNISNGTFNLVNGTLNGNSKTGVNVNGSNASFNMTGGLITGASNGVATTNGAKVNISGGSITSCTNAGIDLVSGATLTLSGTPNISSNSSRNVYLESGALISLGELTSGASIGVTSATSITGSNSVQITSSETSTYYYENAINYIHSDNSSYKVSINHASSGYLTLISTSYVNINVAIHYTNGTNYSNTIYFHDSGDAWHEGSNTALSSYSGTYAYNTYVQYGIWSVSSNFGFVISANTDNMWYSGFARNNTFTINWSESNYYLWNNQYYWNSESDTGTCEWGCTFSSLTSGIMSAIGDFVIVLELSSADISNSNSSTNNIVSNAYFIVDGVKQNLV